MEKFHLLARVKHTVTDVVTLTVEAENEAEAFDKAKEALLVYPRPHDVEGIPYCYIEHRVFNDTQLEDLQNMEEEKSA